MADYFPETSLPSSPYKGSTKPFVIRDPVHGYLVVAVHERLVVDHPVTQRLRRINQTGLAEYVFPEARTSRFVHSLGAMHLASRFVLAALENAEEEVASRFFDEIDSLVPRFSCRRSELDDLLKQDGTLCALAAGRTSFHHEKLKTADIRRLMAVVEGGLRLAALFHDLGHLPMSHDLEYALQDYAVSMQAKETPLPEDLQNIATADAPHEEVGHEIAKLVFHSLLQDASPPERAVFDMATNILTTNNPQYDLRRKPKATALQWLHSLVDGEIDVDRADYLLRDGQALGLDFAHYDVDRLSNSLVLLEDSELGFVTAIKEPGLPALESYCLSRARSNQVFIRHHKVAQTAAALRYASAKAFEAGVASPFLDVLKSLGGGDTKQGVRDLEKFSIFDDTWWIQSLRKFQQKTADPLELACLNLVLDRERTMRSVWKRKGDLTEAQIRAINEKTDGLFALANGRIELGRKRKQLLEKGILSIAFKFRPYSIKKPTQASIMLVKGTNRTEPASAMSALIRNLQDVWKEDVHLYAFVTQQNPIGIDEVVNLILE